MRELQALSFKLKANFRKEVIRMPVKWNRSKKAEQPKVEKPKAAKPPKANKPKAAKPPKGEQKPNGEKEAK